MPYFDNIPEALEYVVSTMNIVVYFDYDHANAVQQKQVEKQKGKVDRYPLLVLYLDMEELRDQGTKFITEAPVRIAIMVPTGKTWTAQQRLERNFKPTLWPIYNEFIRALKASRLFGTDEEGNIPHTKRDAYYNSAESAGLQNTMAAHLDAVQLTNLDLKLQLRALEDCLPWKLFNVTWQDSAGTTYNVSSNDQYAERVVKDGGRPEGTGCIPDFLAEYNAIYRLRNKNILS